MNYLNQRNRQRGPHRTGILKPSRSRHRLPGSTDSENEPANGRGVGQHSLIRARQYEAFISYSHEADPGLAAMLQRTLNRIARPPYKWWQWWPPRVFRDQTNLAAAADLAGEIREALLASDSLVLLASPAAADSPWVDGEASTWCTNKPLDRLFIALVEGNLAWDDARGDFDPARTDALPPSLAGVFDAEPLWVDLTAVGRDKASARDPRFLDGAATLAAAIRGADKDALVGEDARQHRRTKQLVAGAVGLLTTLTVVAAAAAVYAFVQRDHARTQARLALSRQLAAQAVAELDVNPERSLTLAARAASTAATNEARDALSRSLRTSLARAVVRVGKTRVWDVAFSADGQRLAAGSEDGKARTWETRSRKLLGTFTAGVPVSSVRFSPDGSLAVIAGSGQSAAKVWRVASEASSPTQSLGVGVLAATFSPDGKLVATAGYDGLQLWRVATGRQVRLPTRPRRSVTLKSVAFSRDGTRVIAAGSIEAGSSSAAWVWDVRRRKLLATFRPPKDVGLVDAAFSADPDSVVTAADDGVARVWDVSAPAEAPLQLAGHADALESATFSSDGRYVLTASDDATARFWDVKTRRTVAVLLGHSGPVLAAAFSRNDRLLATAASDGTLRLWSSPKEPVLELPTRDNKTVRDVAFSPDGRRLATASEDGTARLWTLAKRTASPPLRHGRDRIAGDWVESVSFSRSGARVLTAGDDGTAKVWNARTGARLATLVEPGDSELRAAEFSPDGGVVAAAGADGELHVWRWARGGPGQALPGHTQRVEGVAFAPDGRVLASASWDGTLRLWTRGAAWKKADTLRPGTGRLTSVAFSPDGTTLAAGTWNGPVLLWDMRTYERLAPLPGRATVTSVDFSRDGRFLVSAGDDGAARVFSLETGALVAQLRTTSPSLEAATFSPRGWNVAVGGEGGEAALLDCLACRPLRELVCLAAARVPPTVREQAREAFAACPRRV
jgi:WD40 repeat protein